MNGGSKLTHARSNRWGRISIVGLLTALSFVALASAYSITLARLRSAAAEVRRLRNETGYLEPSSEDQVAAVRLVSDQPMTYRVRIRVPEAVPYRVVYSSVWPADATGPKWNGALPIPPGESIIILRVLKDQRDERWKITGSHEWLRSGVPRKTSRSPVGQSMRLFDDRALVGEGAMMLYGDSTPRGNMIGIFAELQPDVGAI